MDMTTQTPAEAESGDLPRFDSALTEFGTIILLAAVWVVAAVVRQEATFHLGPLLLPLVPLVTTPRDEIRNRDTDADLASQRPGLRPVRLSDR
jgi:hypothetical protein